MKTFTNSTTYKNIKYDCMQYITTKPYSAYMYSRYVLQEPWSDVGKPEVEDVFMIDAFYAYGYARDVLNKRWADVGRPDIEDLITSHNYSSLYTRYFKI